MVFVRKRNPVSKGRGRDWRQRLATAGAAPGIARPSEQLRSIEKRCREGPLFWMPTAPRMGKRGIEASRQRGRVRPIERRAKNSSASPLPLRTSTRGALTTPIWIKRWSVFAWDTALMCRIPQVPRTSLVILWPLVKTHGTDRPGDKPRSFRRPGVNRSLRLHEGVEPPFLFSDRPLCTSTEEVASSVLGR